VVSLSPSTTEIYCAPTSCNGLIGRTSSCDYPTYVSGNSKVVVDGTVPNYQLISELKPDLVIYDTDLYGPAEQEKIKAAGWKTLPFTAKTLDAYLAYMAELSKFTGKETDASSIADRCMLEINNAYGLSKTSKNPPSMAIVVPGPHLLAAGTKSLQADVWRRAGVKVVGPDADKYAEWNAEELIKADPPCILVPQGGTETLMADPRFANLRAVKNNDIVEVKPRAILRVGMDLDLFVKAVAPRIVKAADR
jgi:iron complex transport system substrate-binding protein